MSDPADKRVAFMPVSIRPFGFGSMEVHDTNRNGLVDNGDHIITIPGDFKCLEKYDCIRGGAVSYYRSIFPDLNRLVMDRVRYGWLKTFWNRAQNPINVYDAYGDRRISLGDSVTITRNIDEPIEPICIENIDDLETESRELMPGIEEMSVLTFLRRYPEYSAKIPCASIHKTQKAVNKHSIHGIMIPQ